MRTRVVIAGYGMAGARLAEEIRRRDPAGERVAIVAIGDEPHPPYNRVLLSNVLAGAMSAESVRLQEEGWAVAHGVEVRRGREVVSIDRDGRRVSLDDGTLVGYDVLVLATGARAWVPPVEGLIGDDGELAPGVATFRTLDDCAAIAAGARGGVRVAVLGGGLLGLEAARGLAARGNAVTVVHPRAHLMERQLDHGAGQVLAQVLRGLGVRVLLNSRAARYLPGDGLKLDDGRLVEADLVVVAAGVRPQTAQAWVAGLDVEGGVLVDDDLRTSDPFIHAIGDCARHPGTVPGLVQPAWEQAAALAALLTGTRSPYRGTKVVTRLKASGVDLAALGDVHAAPDDPCAEVLWLSEPSRGRYAKLVVRDERVAGAIALGVPDAAAAITQFYDRGLPVPPDRLALLLGRAMPYGEGAASDGGNPAGLPGTSVVCRCNAVSKDTLVAAWRSGARDLTALASATRATTGCGTCTDQVCGIARWLAQSEKAQAAGTAHAPS
ncbi:FAD-dependent oxidoreductase [Microbispora bryophytorum]|uniref:NAD(P)/FAD-dependent oxidoreductase n=1 Tax=Microbispora bryophytorum subsp. camponoti TaxID=1677852 RepID=A0ABR8L999_9ACTN|nr:FAD-dependent oxidoreductase [Microbispora camponoti]MBD3146185.1 NAD(P)/FAD-dependent oxidoreductase [Microbispora camponoti]